jgi:hypothetical protein
MAGEDWQSRTLGDCATFGSGGTPSKSCDDFWSGTIPWVSAKDLKVFRLHDAEDHVTAEASPLIDQLIANRIQSRTLASLRDTLLPKLLSGELSVVGLESKLEAAS